MTDDTSTRSTSRMHRALLEELLAATEGSAPDDEEILEIEDWEIELVPASEPAPGGAENRSSATGRPG